MIDNGIECVDPHHELDPEVSTQNQSLSTYINPRMEKTLSVTYRALLVIPLAILVAYFISILAMFAGLYFGTRIFTPLYGLAKVAPVAVLLYYVLRLVNYLRQKSLGFPVANDTEFPVPAPYTKRTFKISKHTVDAVSHGYLSFGLAAILVTAYEYSRSMPGRLHIERLQYIYSNSEWVNSVSSTIFSLILPSPIVEAGWQVAVLIVLLFLEFLMIRSIVIITEQITTNFRDDAKERLIAIAVLHYHLVVQVISQWRLTVKITGAVIFNFLLYRSLLWLAVFNLCLESNQGLATLKCIAV